jgi:uncharacterized membrane protein (DUF373 family)
MTDLIIKFYNFFERIIVLVLLCMLMIVVIYATVGFLITIGYTMIERANSTEVHLTMPILHEVFAGFLMILIGLELMKTIVMYLDEHVIHVEVVMSVAMIAIARHAIDVDYKTAPPLAMVGIGVVIIALAVGYYFFKKADLLFVSPSKKSEIPS